MRYSARAIVCCVGKGTLILLAIACGLGAAGLGITTCEQAQSRAREAALTARSVRCDELRTRYHATDDEVIRKAIEAEWETDCAVDPYASSSLPGWVGAVAGGAAAFAFAAAILFVICSSQISSCQVAVDSGRRPWYWVPRWGNPLPPRERVVTCEACRSTREETEDEYRARLGLAPL